MKIVIAGASGFVGSHLTEHFKEHELVLLSTKSREGFTHWNPEDKRVDLSSLEGCDVVINLAGESLIGRWSKEKMKQIEKSRIEATQFLAESLLRLQKLPALLINASAIGYYGDRGEEVLTETSGVGSGFLSEVCENWEALTAGVASRGVRVVLARFGLILGSDGGLLKQMEKPFKMGMGGYLGSGEQMMSWMAIDDLLSAMDLLIHDDSISGAVNFVAPGAVSNREFTHLLAKALGKSASLPIPKIALKMLFGEATQMFLASVHVHPEKLLAKNFQFECSTLEEALKKYLPIIA